MITARRAVIIALLALAGWMAASVSRNFCTTTDEIAHLTAGYAYWTTGDYRLQPENGSLPQRWVALPLLAAGPQFPAPATAAWRQGDVWRTGFDFFYTLGNDPARMLAAARTMTALLNVALMALVLVWARSLFGWAGALVSLLLAVFCPDLLAHAGLATSDTAAALGFTAALLAWWRLCHRVSPSRVLIAGGTLGLLALAKYSAVIFAPIALALCFGRLLHRAPLPAGWGRRVRWCRGWRRAGALAAGGMTAGLVAVAVIWAGYGFRFAALRPAEAATGRLAFSWDEVLMTTPRQLGMEMADGRPATETADLRAGALQHLIAWSRDHRVLPEAWLYGLACVDRFSRYRLEYFAGEYRTTGWPEFFPAAFLLKTTLPALGLAFAALGAPLVWPRTRRSRLLYRLTPLLVFLAVYWAFAITSHLNIGHRHLLPTYPVLYILTGAAGWTAWRSRRRWPAAAVALALAWHVAESWHARPYYLAYFNELAGGPDNARRYFVDSSLDWGQDLPGLRLWLDAHARGEKIFLSYFGSGDPVAEGITATRVADTYFDLRPRSALPVMTGGVYCLSATMLERVYTQVRGPWSADYEREYQRLTAWLHRLNLQPAGTAPADTDGTPLAPGELQTRLVNLEHLRFGRLCHFLQLRPPDDNIGHSILIYRLTDAEVTLALQAPLPVLNAAVLAQKKR